MFQDVPFAHVRATQGRHCLLPALQRGLRQGVARNLVSDFDYSGMKEIYFPSSLLSFSLLPFEENYTQQYKTMNILDPTDGGTSAKYLRSLQSMLAH
jgi:hypothetical protein